MFLASVWLVDGAKHSTVRNGVLRSTLVTLKCRLEEGHHSFNIAPHQSDTQATKSVISSFTAGKSNTFTPQLDALNGAVLLNSVLFRLNPVPAVYVVSVALNVNVQLL